MENAKFSKENEKTLQTITGIVEGDISTLCYKYAYKPLMLTNGNVERNQLNDKIVNIIETYDIIDKSILLCKSLKDKNTRKIREIENSYNDEFEEKLIEWIGQIYIAFEGNLNKPKLLELFKISLDNSNIYEICNMIESGKYKGYYDYIERFVKIKDTGIK